MLLVALFEGVLVAAGAVPVGVEPVEAPLEAASLGLVVPSLKVSALMQLN